MRVPVYNTAGDIISDVELWDEIFALPFNSPLVHQALVAQQSNQRSGTVKVKTRAEVTGSGRKIYIQKHTGRARQGMARAPHRRGGSQAFGPRPRSFRQSLNKKMRVLALKSLLSQKVTEGEMLVLEEIKMDKPRTKDMISLLKTFKAESKTLIVPDKLEPNLVKSIRNIPGVNALPPSMLNVADLLSYRKMLISKQAIETVHNLWGHAPSKALAADN